jgi:hypothetical protein
MATSVSVRGSSDPSLARSSRARDLRVLGRLGIVGAPLIFGSLLAAANPAAAGTGTIDPTGLRYDIQFTTTSMMSTDGQPTAGANTGLAHVAMANGNVRIDVVSGEFGAVMGSGDFMIYRDTGHSATIYKPSMTKYFQLDLQKLSAGLTKTVNGFGAALGVKATDVKLDLASLGAGDKVGPLATVKYRLTQDYTLTMSFLGMPGHSTKMHSTTDYWFTPSLTMMVNPFAQTIQETAWLGAEYGKQLSALQAKLPKGIAVKQVMTDVATDSAGTKTTTTVTWALVDFVRASFPDATFQPPAGYTQIQGGQGPATLMQTLSGLMNRGAPTAMTNGNPAGAQAGNASAGHQWNGSAPSTTGGMPAGSANGTTSTWNGSTPSGAAGGTTSGAPSSDPGMDSAAKRLSKLLPQ